MKWISHLASDQAFQVRVLARAQKIYSVTQGKFEIARPFQVRPKTTQGFWAPCTLKWYKASPGESTTTKRKIRCERIFWNNILLCSQKNFNEQKKILHVSIVIRLFMAVAIQITVHIVCGVNMSTLILVIDRNPVKDWCGQYALNHVAKNAWSFTYASPVILKERIGLLKMTILTASFHYQKYLQSNFYRRWLDHVKLFVSQNKNSPNWWVFLYHRKQYTIPSQLPLAAHCDKRDFVYSLEDYYRCLHAFSWYQQHR